MTLANNADGPLNRPGPDTDQYAYSSRALALFIGHLERRVRANLFDAGPVCGDNITYMAPRVRRLYIHDLSRAHRRRQRDDRSAGPLWPTLNYPAGIFDAVQIWELGDHMEDGDFKGLIGFCAQILRPCGLLMMISAAEGTNAKEANRYMVRDGARLEVKPLTDAVPARQYRHNRDLIAMARPLKMVKSFIYRNGLREFLFEHP